MRADSAITILSGPNNSGKSLLMKRLKKHLGIDAHMLGCGRFYQLDTLQIHGGHHEEEKLSWHENFLAQNTGMVNNDTNSIDLGSTVMRLKNTERNKLFDLCGEVIGGKFALKLVDEENDFSPKYVDLDGTHTRSVSSGTRLVMTLLAACLDTYFSHLLIDEPEIGISPGAQAMIARYLFDPQLRQRWFPHLTRIFISTHSHLFLDRADISNNFAVTKELDGIHIKQINSMAEFHHLQFNMLGNELESMFLPSAIIGVEGPSDQIVLRRALELRFPERRITIINCATESAMGDKMHILGEVLGNISLSPYRSRIFWLLDAANTRGRKGTEEKLLKQGIPKENIVVFTKNGIEYYYPQQIMRDIFRCGENPVGEPNVGKDDIAVNGIRKTKVALANEVATKLDSSSKFGQELENFLGQVGGAASTVPTVT